MRHIEEPWINLTKQPDGELFQGVSRIRRGAKRELKSDDCTPEYDS